MVGVAVPGQPAQHPALPGPGAAEAGEFEAPGVAVDSVDSIDIVDIEHSDNIHLSAPSCSALQVTVSALPRLASSSAWVRVTRWLPGRASTCSLLALHSRHNVLSDTAVWGRCIVYVKENMQDVDRQNVIYVP